MLIPSAMHHSSLLLATVDDFHATFNGLQKIFNTRGHFLYSLSEISLIPGALLALASLTLVRIVKWASWFSRTHQPFHLWKRLILSRAGIGVSKMLLQFALRDLQSATLALFEQASALGKIVWVLHEALPLYSLLLPLLEHILGSRYGHDSLPNVIN